MENHCYRSAQENPDFGSLMENGKREKGNEGCREEQIRNPKRRPEPLDELGTGFVEGFEIRNPHGEIVK